MLNPAFQQQVALHKDLLVHFLSQLEQAAPPQLDALAEKMEPDVWRETECLACAGCCRNMSPTYTVEDIKRIATHLRMSVPAFKNKWLYQNKNGAWMNRSQPCPFLDLQTNKCSIYAVRPADCAAFPHLAKKKMVDYLHVHRQNLRYCPATFKLVEKLAALQDRGGFAL